MIMYKDIQEIYRLMILNKWVATEQHQIDDIRTVVISPRPRMGPGSYARKGAKFDNVSRYSKVIFFNTATGQIFVKSFSKMAFEEYLNGLEQELDKQSPSGISITTSETIL